MLPHVNKTAWLISILKKSNTWTCLSDRQEKIHNFDSSRNDPQLSAFVRIFILPVYFERENPNSDNSIRIIEIIILRKQLKLLTYKLLIG